MNLPDLMEKLRVARDEWHEEGVRDADIVVLADAADWMSLHSVLAVYRKRIESGTPVIVID